MNRTSRHNRHNHRRTGSYSKRQVRWASPIIVAVVKSDADADADTASDSEEE